MLNNQLVYFYHKKDENTLKQVTPLYELIVQNGSSLTDSFTKATFIITVGDDETFLQALRRTNYRSDCYYLGINSFDTPSIYCDFHLDQLDEIIDYLYSNLLNIKKYPLLQIKMDDYYKCFCIHEFSIRSTINRSLNMNVLIDGEALETCGGEGMLVTTPTGSLSSNKNFGGALVDDNLLSYQLTEVAPIRNSVYRSFSSPILLSKNRKLTLQLSTNQQMYPSVVIDNDSIQSKDLAHIYIELIDATVQIIHKNDHNYYTKLKQLFL